MKAGVAFFDRFDIFLNLVKKSICLVRSLFLTIIITYFILLYAVSWFTSRKANNESFFLGNRKSPWIIVAIGMVGSSISGVTFISVPGWVVDSQFSYMQMVLGYLAGYVVIAEILLPLYYRLKLTSIYTYLDGRFGKRSYKTGASFFLLSRSIGTAFRLYLMASVLQLVVFDAWNVPFFVTVLVTLGLILLYTYKGGIRTIIWTDVLQTVFMLTAVILTIIMIARSEGFEIGQIFKTVADHEYSRIFFFDDFADPKHFVKQFLGGMFITIVMTGLDQDMMQKNLSCRNLKDASKNVYLYSASFIPVNLLFLSLGVLLVIFAGMKGIAIPAMRDELYPLIATKGGLGMVIPVLFILGLIAAAYSSADSALTALTTSFTIDILGAGGKDEKSITRTRKRVHIGVTLAVMAIILAFREINDQSVISAVFTVAGYTYGPLLGLFAFGLFTKLDVRDNLTPYIAVASPIITYFVNKYSVQLLWGYKFGFELLVLNGLITFAGLLIFSSRKKSIV
jgi:solute:Na+ symporter, SSS family